MKKELEVRGYDFMGKDNEMKRTIDIDRIESYLPEKLLPAMGPFPEVVGTRVKMYSGDTHEILETYDEFKELITKLREGRLEL